MFYRVLGHSTIVSLIFYWIFKNLDFVRGSEYIVNTEKCKLPHHEPFNNETLGIWFSEYYEPCSSKPLLSRVKKTNSKATLHIEEHLLPLYGQNVTCCVADIIRETEDRIRWTECKPFTHKTDLNSDTVTILCLDESGQEVYKNAHHAVLKNSETEEKFNRITTGIKPTSVLFIVIDSVSRLNLIRTMPKTRDYLLDNSFIELKGYSKIDDNTFPNFVALLTGLNKRQISTIHCTGRNINEFDNCPMIWYNFSKSGYVTAYGEDWGYLNTFNYHKKGFTNPPTDFYYRPYVLATESLGTLLLKGAPFCAGPESSGERQLNLALDFSKTFKNSPYFGIFWMNTFSHQALNIPHRFDDKLREFFTNLKAEGILEDSIVILLSDHGMRLDHTIKRTITGWFEERLPVNLISVPEWFERKYPEKIKNLKVNSDKLTSTYDLYMTLQDILQLSSQEYKMVPSLACPKCVSLFNEVPTRTCSEAGIPQEWCTCIGHMQYLNQTSYLAIKGAQFVLNRIKSKLNLFNLTQVCSEFRISYIKTAGLSETSEFNNEKYMFLNFVASPYAEFIVSLKYKKVESTRREKFSILLDAVRLDKGDNTCISISEISQFCNCKR